MSYRRSALALTPLLISCVMQPSSVSVGGAAAFCQPERSPASQIRHSFGVIHRWFPLRWSGTQVPWLDDAALFVNDGVRPKRRRRAGSLPQTRNVAANVPSRAEVELIASVRHGRLRLVVRNATAKTFVAGNWLDWLLVTQQARDIDGRFVSIERIPRRPLTYCTDGPRGRRLASRQQWVFYPRRYVGPLLTELRFCLRSHAGRQRCSNTFIGGVTPGQLDGVLVWPEARRSLHPD